MIENNSDKSSNFDVFSFWKPDPVPPKNTQILPIELHSLGKLSEVAERLFDVPHMTKIAPDIWDPLEADSGIQLQWDVEAGVFLHIRTEQGPPLPGEVLTIRARSRTPDRIFYRLYIQLFEQFGVTVLDEKRHDFVTPREFREGLHR